MVLLCSITGSTGSGDPLGRAVEEHVAAAVGLDPLGAMAHAAAVWPGFTMRMRAHYDASAGG